jgi:Na+-translocating ferredoxin:NAD+ oxidoreductase RnfC subunit
VIDPRVIDRMGIVPSELPGYELNQEEKDALKTLENYRVEAKNQEEMGERTARIEALEHQKRQAEMALEYEKMQESKASKKSTGQ